MRGRWPLIDAEVDRLGVGNHSPYDAICAVCDANNITRPLGTDDAQKSGQKIEDELKRREIRRLSAIHRANKGNDQ